MRESIKSLMSFSWAMALYGVRQLQNALTAPRAGGAADAFRAIAQAAETQLAGPVKELFQAGERMQGNVVDWLFGATRPRPDPPRPRGRAPRWPC